MVLAFWSQENEINGVEWVKFQPDKCPRAVEQQKTNRQEQIEHKVTQIQVSAINVIKFIESLSRLTVKVGGAKESFPKGLNRSEHLAETSSYGLNFDVSQSD